METPVAARRYDIDWLRVFATYVLFAFHTAKVFDVPPYYPIKNAHLSTRLGYFTGFVHQWHMPLFFLLAGWAAFGSLRQRGTTGFLRERLRKLLVPFVAGCVLLCPILKYLELLAGAPILPDGRIGTGVAFHERFVDFLPTFFTRLDRFSWSHLWFLIYLFTFTLLYLPLFRRLSARATANPRVSVPMVYLPIVPLVLIQTTLRWRWPGVQNLYDDWGNFSYYSLYFILGFTLAWVPTFESALHREWRRAGVIGVVALVLMIPDLGPLPNRALSGVAGWCCVVALLGLAAASLNFSNRALRYLSESAFPVYILHQVGVVVVGYVVIQSAAGIGAKSLLVLVGSVAATLATYHFVVRPVGVLRLLFGMKPVERLPARVADSVSLA
ncbi:MAG TPA: acyltransferase family protein [Candidatus Kryptonia bacterium]|nr:acyltransferase family protein [Candidatus Kryptonia bacterium]